MPILTKIKVRYVMFMIGVCWSFSFQVLIDALNENSLTFKTPSPSVFRNIIPLEAATWSM